MICWTLPHNPRMQEKATTFTNNNNNNNNSYCFSELSYFSITGLNAFEDICWRWQEYYHILRSMVWESTQEDRVGWGVEGLLYTLCMHGDSVCWTFFLMYVQFSPLIDWVVGGGGHEGWFSRDPLPVLSAGGPCEQFWYGQGCPLFDVVHPAFSLLITALPTLQGALKDGLGGVVVACDMPEPSLWM